MASFRNPRRRFVQSVNPHQNAEGIIPLSFKGLLLHKLEEQDFISKRNDLDVTKFTAINPVNGETISVLTQLQLRDQILDAFDRKAEGQVAILESVSGGRCRPDFKTGMTTIAARSLKLAFKPAKTAVDSGDFGPVLVSQEALAATEPAVSAAQ